MKARPPRIRLVIDNIRALPTKPAPKPPRWIDLHREEIVTRALVLVRDIKLPLAEKERIIREDLDRQAGIKR